ncbi:MAG: T9SS type A sorting domain-containing protein [Luteibaculum sp.]
MKRHHHWKVFLLFAFFLAHCPGFAQVFRVRVIANANPSYNMCVAWQEPLNNPGTVHYGKQNYGLDAGAYQFLQDPERNVFTKAMNTTFSYLKNLEPNTTYYFVIRQGTEVHGPYMFKTVPDDANEPLSFVFGGNMGDNRNQRQAAFRLISKLRPDLVILGGDFTSLSTPLEWQNWFDDWNLSSSSDGRLYPIIPVKGDRELLDSDLFNLFGLQDDRSYYAIDVGRNLARFYVLNSSRSADEVQRLWFNNDLSLNAVSKYWKLAFYHNPIRAHATGDFDDENAKNQWVGLFNQYRFQAAFEGGGGVHKLTEAIIPFSGSGAEDGFKKDALRGLHYFGEGSLTQALPDNVNSRSWTADAADIQQLKWVSLSEEAMLVKTVDISAEPNTEEKNPSEEKFKDPEGIAIRRVQSKEFFEVPRIKEGQAFVEIVEPTYNEYLLNPSVQVTWDAAVKGGGSIDRIRIFLDQSLEADLGGSAKNYQLSGLSPGKHTVQIIANSASGAQALSLEIPFFIQEKEKSSGVPVGSYDAEENKLLGLVSTDNTELVLGQRSVAGIPQATLVGLVFSDINIPPGATLTNAYIQFTAARGGEDAATQLFIYLINDLSPQAFSNQLFDISGRPRASSFEFWDVKPWSLAFLSGENQRSPDLKNMIEDLFNVKSKGLNQLGILIEGSGTRTALSYEGDLRKVPKLVVKYTEPVTSIKKEKAFAAIGIYPNPVEDLLWIKNPYSNAINFILVDAQGKQVKEAQLPPLLNSSINMEEYESGTYMLKYSNNEVQGSIVIHKR